MDFPPYVPKAVRRHISAILDGKFGEKGFRVLLAEATARLEEIEAEIAVRIERGETGRLDDLRRRKAEAIKTRDRLASDVDSLRRLAHDARMREVYAILIRELPDEMQWRGFVYAAWSARIDFTPYREALKQAKELKDKIARAAEKLAALIRKFHNLHVGGPFEFYSFYELLGKAATDPERPANAVMWKREYEKLFVNNGYAWSIAPDVPALIDALAKAALTAELGESGWTGVAIESQKRNPKFEYIRAFCALLKDEHGLRLTPPILRAVADTAAVICDVDVSYDDVRKAIRKLG